MTHLVIIGLYLIAAWSLGSLFIYFILGAIGLSIAGITQAIKKSRLLGLILVALIGLGIYAGITFLFSKPSQASVKAVTQPASYCKLDHTKFIKDLNDLRASLNLGTVSEDQSMDKVASARVQDMLTNKYYGHYNPVTKESVATEVQKQTNYQYYAEVLDGPLRSADAFNNFKNHPEHYQIITNPDIKYIGIDSQYEPDTVQSYDNNGVVVPNTSGSQYCTVVADVAY